MLEPVSTRAIAAELARARTQTASVIEPLSDEQLVQQVSPIQSPIVWDFAHIGYFEEFWLLRELGGEPPLDGDYDDLYDAFAHERAERAALPILDPGAARAYVAEVRARVLTLLDGIQFDGSDRLLEGGLIFGMVVQHELQHIETITQTLQLAGFPGPVPGGPPEVAAEGVR